MAKNKKEKEKKERGNYWDKERGALVVEVCDECGKDNWQYPLLEFKFKKNKTSFWLCNDCTAKMLDKMKGFKKRIYENGLRNGQEELKNDRTYL